MNIIEMYMSLIKHCKQYLINERAWALKLWQLVHKKWLSLFGSNLFGSNVIFGSNIFLRIKSFFGYIYSDLILITFLAHVDVMSLPQDDFGSVAIMVRTPKCLKSERCCSDFRRKFVSEIRTNGPNRRIFVRFYT